jgi:hypothetical protein
MHVLGTVKDHFARLERLQLTAASLQLIDERPNALKILYRITKKM